MIQRNHKHDEEYEWISEAINFVLKINFTLQHPLADFEIVCWDSTLVLIISKHEEFVQAFQNSFPLAVDLAVYNK